ncbi:hypothetical protein [Photobacterium sp. 1_MG-2023]|uniref:hypothetical protein n=1 Tax=Photobacterium sp. 1_MG-2023 TaxID=3062646 RepID=UPI0026E38684|nr:hypothetical protein [Photobacterium sp. 1_MG-2023]MDO6706008.1 hypothetical protein [Photobacterium sp. 1_MG-2023]
MDMSDFDGIKRDISLKVEHIFEVYENEHYCMPTMEEFRALFNEHIDEYVGPDDSLRGSGLGMPSDLKQRREQKVWRVVSELEAEQRTLRSDEDSYMA